MPAGQDGVPCWTDAMFTDVEGAKRFYGEVLGWTFAEASTEYGGYTQAFSDGKAVAAVVPPMPGQEEGPSAWCLYLRSSDVAATAERIRSSGGSVIMEPMQVGDFGSMCLAREPSGAVFGVWQPGSHAGFEKEGEPGSYAWAEVYTREPERTDAFFPAVFPYATKRMVDPQMDYRFFQVGEQPALGRMKMEPSDFPAEIPPYIQVYFGVPDCDAAVAAAERLGGQKVFGPMDSPFGRFAAIVDPQGAAFAVIDMATTEGEMPEMV